MGTVPDLLILRKLGSPGNRTRDLWICSQELWPLDHRVCPPLLYTFLIVVVECLIWSETYIPSARGMYTQTKDQYCTVGTY
jgi:hypothetical protein